MIGAELTFGVAVGLPRLLSAQVRSFANDGFRVGYGSPSRNRASKSRLRPPLVPDRSQRHSCRLSTESCAGATEALRRP